MDEIVAEFLVESYESLDRLDRDLLALERDPGSRDVLASIFRTMHTIKGTCGFLGFLKLERISHAAESLLAGVRDGSLAITPQTAGVLLATGDVLRLILRQIEVSGTDGDDDHDALVAELERLRMAPESADPTTTTAAEATPQPAAPTRGARPRSAFTDTTVRVDVGLLDRLMTLVGELVLTRNHLVELAVDRPDPSLASAAQSVDHITAELQEKRDEDETAADARRGAPSQGRPRPRRRADKRARMRPSAMTPSSDRSIIEAIKDLDAHRAQRGRPWHRGTRAAGRGRQARGRCRPSGPTTRAARSRSRCPMTARGSSWKPSERRRSSSPR
jgi:two-component system chemotaxis sensor kinase CheA